MVAYGFWLVKGQEPKERTTTCAGKQVTKTNALETLVIARRPVDTYLWLVEQHGRVRHSNFIERSFGRDQAISKGSLSVTPRRSAELRFSTGTGAAMHAATPRPTP